MASPAPNLRQRLKLNLLIPQGIPQKLPIRFLKWLISYGRFIAVLVEIIVIGAFVTRFKLDADLSGIKEKINNQVPYIESLSQDEALIKRTQFKLTTINNIYNDTPAWKNILDKISSLIPPQVKLTSITLDRGANSKSLQFKMNGVAVSNSDLESLIAGLRNESSFKGVSLASISFDQGQITFTITGAIQ